MSDVDLSVEVCGLTFRNPILPGSSDVILDERGVEQCLKQGIGGIVTKTFTSGPLRTRARPYHFNYRVFGKGLEVNWITRGSFHCMSAEEAAEELVPKMARLCHDEGIPLVVSIGNGADVDEWVKDAKMFEEVGADMFELNFACPHGAGQIGTAVGGTVGQDIPLTLEIMKALKKAVKIPISPKGALNPSSYSSHVKGLVEAGADCFTPGGGGGTGMLIDVEAEVPFGGLGAGGYQMGRASLPLGIAKIVQIRNLTEVPLIATGGVHQAVDALMYMLVGASLVEVVGAVYTKGWRVYAELIQGIEEWMRRKGYSSTKDFIGKVHNIATKSSARSFMSMEWPFPMPQEESSPVIPSIDMGECILCGKCEDFCLSGVFTVDKAKSIVDINHENRCWGCGDCVGWCPANAIVLIDKATKEVIWDNHGLAKPYRPENWIG